MNTPPKDPPQQNDAAEEVDLEQYAARGEKPPNARTYVIRIDDERHRVHTVALTGRELLSLAKRQPPDAYTVEQVLRGGEHHVVCPDQKVDLTTPGVERFVTRAGVAFYIDQEEVFTPTPTLTVREILTDYAKVDATQTTLVELRGAEQVKHTNLDERLPVACCVRVVVFDTTPTPVS
jgi:hypothetical protein